jgi:hypothetical protein
MTDRQILWGLSNGVTVFALSGAFWVGLGIGMAAQVHWSVVTLGTVVQFAGCASLIWAAMRLRRKSGFRRADLRALAGRDQAETRHIKAALLWTMLAQTLLIGAAVWACVQAHAESRIWPSIALAVSLHLVPLARIFHVRAYYGTAVIGTIVAVAGLVAPSGTYSVPALGAAMATVMWLSAVYLLAQAECLAKRAKHEKWAI